MYFDVAMPLTLFIVTIVAMFIGRRVEGKLKTTFEEREFSVRDAVLLVAVISVAVSVIVFIPQMAIMVMFLFSYSMLLFIFTYIFSDFRRAKAQLFSLIFLFVSLIAAAFSLFVFGANEIGMYSALIFFGFAGFTFLALVYEEGRAIAGERWHLAVLPPTLFVFLYMFFGQTWIWFPYLLNLYGIIFAVLIIAYLGSLFTWRTTLIFVGLLTVVDIILVLITGSMVSAATHISELRLPIMISLPTIPITAADWGMLYMSLGLGDFFFAGLIGIQTMKKFGKKTAIMSIIAMCISFFFFEAYLLNYRLRAFPGTLMIILGWLPILVWQTIRHKTVEENVQTKIRSF